MIISNILHRIMPRSKSNSKSKKMLQRIEFILTWCVWKRKLHCSLDVWQILFEDHSNY